MKEKYTKIINDMNTYTFSIIYKNTYYVYRRPSVHRYVEERLEDNSES